MSRNRILKILKQQQHNWKIISGLTVHGCPEHPIHTGPTHLLQVRVSSKLGIFRELCGEFLPFGLNDFFNLDLGELVENTIWAKKDEVGLVCNPCYINVGLCDNTAGSPPIFLHFCLAVTKSSWNLNNFVKELTYRKTAWNYTHWRCYFFTVNVDPLDCVILVHVASRLIDSLLLVLVAGLVITGQWVYIFTIFGADHRSTVTNMRHNSHTLRQKTNQSARTWFIFYFH